MKLSVFGGGSWGTAVAHQMARRGHDVLLWAREPEVAEGINSDHRNPLFVSDLDLDPGIRAVDDLAAAAGHADVWLWVVPVQFSRSVMEELRPVTGDQVVVVSASKGIETGTLRRMDEVAGDALGVEPNRFCCLSGPTFAREVILGDPSAAVLACPDLDLAARLQEEFSDHHMRCYAGTDLIGVELAGALKNVIAIAAGIVDGLGLGFNTQAALMTRGLHEITRLGVALGADAETFRGLAGMGDLVLTCTGGLSRNRTLGQRLGRGESLDSILGSQREVVEGVRTTPAAAKLAEDHGVVMPITDAMTRLLTGEVDPQTALRELMTRELRVEAEL
ncbi:MAG: NAD(P)H-dependent glycerol-3-phosphate dehydrogenase [Acidobacteriota bacterium]|nr:NAD(P)H-dependent glycerol-3-phosphate dehydrogenase [Acidobacteriota bacterium]